MAKTVATPSSVPTLGATLASAHKAYASGDHLEAVRLFRQAIDITPDSAEGYFNLGTVLLESKSWA